MSTVTPYGKNTEYAKFEEEMHNSSKETEIEKTFDRRRYADKEIPAYYTNTKVRRAINCRLRELNKQNAKIWKDEGELNEIKVKLAQEIKSIDPLYYKELYPENNVTENY